VAELARGADPWPIAQTECTALALHPASAGIPPELKEVERFEVLLDEVRLHDRVGVKFAAWAALIAWIQELGADPALLIHVRIVVGMKPLLGHRSSQFRLGLTWSKPQPKSSGGR
jgi:hypothetical protein